MGCVEELPNGRFKGVPWNSAASKRGKSKVFDRWEQADAYCTRAEAEMDGDYSAVGIDVTRRNRRLPLLAEHVTEWAKAGIEDGELSTVKGYQSQARMLAARWPTEQVDEITELMVRGYLAELRDTGASPSTRTLRLTVLRHAMRAAVKAGYRPDDPTLGIKAPKRRETQPRILTDSELMMLLACLPGWLWAAALVSHDAGLRIDEIAGLRMQSLNLLHGTVTVVDIIDVDGSLRAYPKSKILRDLPLSPRALAALRDHVRDYPPAGKLAPVFAARKGKHLLPSRIRDEWDRALLLANFDGKKPTWHDLRHGCATALDEAGVDSSVIQAILGHRNLATTQRYIRRANLTRQSAAVRLAFGEKAIPELGTAI